MSIVCGTDFSTSATGAELAAAHVAARSRQTLHLVHAIEILGEDDVAEPLAALVAAARRRLAQRADVLARTGCTIESQVEVTTPDAALITIAERVRATLIVVGAHGSRDPALWPLGSHTDRVCQRAPVPVLVVRDSGPFERWAREGRPLRALVGVDLTVGSIAALRWMAVLRRLGPIATSAVHVYWPPGEHDRLGLGGARTLVDPEKEILQVLERDLRARMADELGAADVPLRIELSLGRVGDRLAAAGREADADLVVVGTHQRNALTRLWEGSVSRGVLHHASSSVVCVPASRDAVPVARDLRVLLVATDFSSLGNSAISTALGLARAGTTVHLVHVEPGGRHDPGTPRDVFAPQEASRAVREQLLALMPRHPPDVAVQAHVLHSDEPAVAICQAAERLGAGLICLGTHGRGGLSAALLGSVAREVIARTHRAVLLSRLPA